jgi:hypothetical protein
MADDRQPGPRRDRGDDRLDDLLGMPDRQRHPRHDHPGLRLVRDELDRVEDGVVLVIGRQELVARPDSQGAQHGRDAGGRVRDDDDAGGVGAEEARDLDPGGVATGLELAVEDPDRAGLELIEHRPLGFDDRHGAGAERAVGEVGQARLESPRRVGPVRSHGRSIATGGSRQSRPSRRVSVSNRR